MRLPSLFLSTLFVAVATGATALAHPPAGDHQAAARYIANEGVLVADGDVKILFDPLFQTSFDIYRTPSDEQRTAMLGGEAPYDGVAAVFISHAHGDHFSADDVNAYLAAQKEVRLVAPRAAVDMLQAARGWREDFTKRILPLDLDYEDAAVTLDIGETIEVDAVFIPHAGWPRTRDVQNIVYRVTTGDHVTVIHMGDADDNDAHFAPYDAVWRARRTDMAFPPFWFFRSPETRAILSDRLNIERSVGVHVPVAPPARLSSLRDEGAVDFFTEPGAVRMITPAKGGE